MITRRSFIHDATAVAALSAAGVSLTRGEARAESVAVATPGKDPLRLGVAGYTFHKFKIDPALEMMKAVDVHYLCIKDFHLAMDCTDEQIASFHARCRAASVEGYGVGPIYMGSEAEVNRAFDYARRVGVRLVVGVPFKTVGDKRVASPELLQLINRKVQELDFKYAIHNHGPDMPELFPSAESTMQLIRTLDRRVGLCLDIGHDYRDGKNPIKSLEDYSERVHDIHLKNVNTPDAKGTGVELPRGGIDLVAFVRTLRKVRYPGVCSLEYEKDPDDPLLGLAESVGYFRGLMDATRPDASRPPGQA